MLKKLVKRVIISLILLLTSSSIFAQIRSYVGIVRQQYFPEHIKYFEKYRDELKENGYSTYAKYVDSYLKGGFGSGFVYVAADGTNYIITNRHVVSQAASASVEFEDAETGDIKKYENLSVLLTDDEIDIAILGFANGEKPFKRGLTLSSANVTDGQEVWSAGFPGLGSDPVWQLGKGTVTNSRARIKDLLDPLISTIIQHSAQVDGGNSGGPLMISSKNAIAGYEVVGINTWKASSRESTNFAIPAKMIQKMLADLQKKSASSADKTLLSERANKLAASLKDLGVDFSNVAKYISYERASSQGQKDFESVLHFAPSKVRSLVLEAFSFDPAEGLRYASAYQVWKKYSAEANDGIKYTASEPKSADGKTTVDFTSDGEQPTSVTTTWIKEHGLWRLSELSSDVNEDDDSKKSKKSKKNSKSKKDGTDGYFASPQVDGYDRTVLSADADLSVNGKAPAFRFGADFFGGSEFFGTSLMYHYEKLDCSGDEKAFNAFGIGFIFRVPVKMGEFGLNPYGKLNGNFAFGDSRLLIGYNAEVGLQAMFNTDHDIHFGLGAGFKQLYLTQWMNFNTGSDYGEKDKIDPFTNRGISIYAILSF
ncbi:MAG: trypsin-like peptidase domain-containing protein [Treponema sp.]|nr:trypsin-like peptidase domain-containing protein [Treponema sp.]